MSIERRNFAAAVLNDKIYVCGGESLKDIKLATVEVYDPKTDR